MRSRQTDQETGRCKTWIHLAGRSVKNVGKSRRRAKIDGPKETPKVDAAREQRGICFIPNDDPDYEEIMHNERKFGEQESGQRCHAKSPNQPTRLVQAGGGPCASDGSQIGDEKMLNSVCLWKDPEDKITESQRIRITRNTKNTRKDHLADRGQVSMSHIRHRCTSQ